MGASYGYIAALSLLAVSLGLGVSAGAARAECAGAATTVAAAACLAAAYRAEDARLNTLYRSLRAVLVAQDKTPPAGTRAASLQQAQRQWIVLRDMDCRLEANSAQGGTIAPLIEQDCLTRHTRSRITQLEALFEAYHPR